MVAVRGVIVDKESNNKDYGSETVVFKEQQKYKEHEIPESNPVQNSSKSRDLRFFSDLHASTLFPHLLFLTSTSSLLAPDSWQLRSKLLLFLKQSENNSSISRARHPRKLVAGSCKSRSRRVCASPRGRDLQDIYTQPFGVCIFNLFRGKSEIIVAIFILFYPAQ